MFLINIILILLVPFLLVRHDSRRREMERTTWIAGVSHDIRTPLSLVLGYADEILHIAEDSMESETVDESVRQSIADRAQIIEEQAVRIRTLVTNLNMENKLTYGIPSKHSTTILRSANDECEIIVDGKTYSYTFKPKESHSFQVRKLVDIQDEDQVSRNITVKIKEKGCPEYNDSRSVIFERYFINN